jgi:uncharacterized protein (DUF1697 family)
VTRYVALLRGINVGGHNKVPMADLRALLAGLGHTAVGTYLQSGNALFDSPEADPGRLERQLEKALAADLGVAVRCLVRSAADLRGVVEREPFGAVATDPKRYLVAFLEDGSDLARLRAVDPAGFAPEELRYGARELYLWCPAGIADTRFTPAFWKKVGLVTTARNWNTVRKLLALAET